MTDGSQQEKTRIIQLTHWPDYHPFPTIAGLRYLRFYKELGFETAFLKCGKTVLVDETEFFRILRSKQIDSDKKTSQGEPTMRKILSQPTKCKE
jgi:hypothetical protein